MDYVGYKLPKICSPCKTAHNFLNNCLQAMRLFPCLSQRVVEFPNIKVSRDKYQLANIKKKILEYKRMKEQVCLSK